MTREFCAIKEKAVSERDYDLCFQRFKSNQQSLTAVVEKIINLPGAPDANVFCSTFNAFSPIGPGPKYAAEQLTMAGFTPPQYVDPQKELECIERKLGGGSQ